MTDTITNRSASGMANVEPGDVIFFEVDGLYASGEVIEHLSAMGQDRLRVKELTGGQTYTIGPSQVRGVK